MENKVLLSIKPEFANKIFNGEKKFEYRRVIFKNKNVSKIVVYASSPVKKVIGEFDVGEIINTSKTELWNKTRKYSGITKDYFDKYFDDKEFGYAIEIKRVERFDKPKCLNEEYGVSSPPQSFVYLK
jgi:predicted transcriptional regulator